MVNTRSASISDFESILDSKLTALKDELPLKESIEELRELILEQGRLVKEQGETISKLQTEISSKEDRIVELESHVAILQNTVKLLKCNTESNEQYQRRLCLRIIGIPPAINDENEDGDKCLEKVKEVLTELNVEIPDSCIDRAHRIGKPFKNKVGKICHCMIVKFTTWRHRTKVYKARKSVDNYTISPDLTKHRFDLLKSARNNLDKEGKNGRVAFMFADVNCRLMAKTSEGRFLSFETLDELKSYC